MRLCLFAADCLFLCMPIGTISNRKTGMKRPMRRRNRRTGLSVCPVGRSAPPPRGVVRPSGRSPPPHPFPQSRDSGVQTNGVTQLWYGQSTDNDKTHSFDQIVATAAAHLVIACEGTDVLRPLRTTHSVIQ